MFKLSTFAYDLKQGFKTLIKSRNYSLAAIATMTACIFMFGVFYFVVTNIRGMMESAETTVGITVFFEDNITYDRIVEIGEKISSDFRVSGIEYHSAEQTWEDYKKNYLSEELAETFGNDNPLENSASYTVYTSNVDYQSAVTEYIRTIDGVRQVNSAEKLTETLQSINRGVFYVSLVLVLLLLFITTFLISITISMGVSAHSEEISIMKLIGATDHFVRGPFVVEGLIIGLVGSAVPLILLALSYSKITELLTEKLSSDFDVIRFIPSHTLFGALVPLALLIGIGVSFLGSFITLNRELNRIA